MLCFILLNDKWLFLTKECSAVIQNKRPPKLAELAFYLKADMYRLSLSLLNVPTRPSGLHYSRIFFAPLIFFSAAYLNLRCLNDHTLKVDLPKVQGCLDTLKICLRSHIISPLMHVSLVS